MTKDEFYANIEQTFASGVALIKSKNADYGADADPFHNFRKSTLIGITPDKAILVRLSDKLTRLANLLDRDAQVSSEKLEDTILDAINYLAILKAYRDDLAESKNS